MNRTIYASFADPADAERAAGALLDHGVASEDISIVTGETYQRGDAVPIDTTRAAVTGTAGPIEEPPRARDNYTADPTIGGGHSMQLEHEPMLQTGEHTHSGHATGEEFTQRLGDTRYSSASPFTMTDPVHGTGVGTESERHLHDVPGDRIEPTDTVHRVERDRTGDEVIVAPVDTEEAGAYYDIPGDDDDSEDTAKGGITTTTGADAASGAVKGAGIGLGVGIAAALVSVMIPGVGLVLGGGALASALAGAVATTAAGAAAGGVVGFLKDQGVPDESARRYAEIHAAGGAILAVRTPSGDADEVTISSLLGKYGATEVQGYDTPVVA
jgi:hypothetical protein